MKELTILVDFDDTLNNFCEVLVDTLNKMFGTSVHHNDVKEWDLRKSFPTLTESQIFIPTYFPDFWRRVSPPPGAVEYLKKMIDDGHKIVVVTATHPSKVGMKIMQVLLRDFPYLTYKDVIISSQKQLIKGDILIDDAPHNLEGGDYYGILVDAPHNRNYDAEAHGFVRAYGWDDIYHCICEYAKKAG